MYTCAESNNPRTTATANHIRKNPPARSGKEKQKETLTRHPTEQSGRQMCVFARKRLASSTSETLNYRSGNPFKRGNAQKHQTPNGFFRNNAPPNRPRETRPHSLPRPEKRGTAAKPPQTKAMAWTQLVPYSATLLKIPGWPTRARSIPSTGQLEKPDFPDSPHEVKPFSRPKASVECSPRQNRKHSTSATTVER